MLRCIGDLFGFEVRAETGPLGTLEDAILDTKGGRITYLLLWPTANPMHQAMVPTAAVRVVDMEHRTIEVATKVRTATVAPPLVTSEQAPRPHPESVRKLLCYSVDATDGKAGQVGDFQFHDDAWTVAKAFIDLAPPGKRLAVDLHELQQLDPARHVCRIQRTRDELLKACEFRAA